MHLTYIPIILTIILSPLYLTLFNIIGYDIPVITPYEDTGLGALSNTIIFISFTTLFGIFLLTILRWPRLLNRIILLLALYIIFSTFSFYLLAFEHYIYSGVVQTVLVYVTPLLITAIAYLSMARRHRAVYSFVLLNSMVGMGVIFDNSLPTMTKLMVIIGYSIFDFVSVNKGILKRMFAQPGVGKNIFEPLLISFGEVGIGVGDILFYSLFIAFSMELLHPFYLLGFAISSFSILIGHLVNLMYLKKKKMIPALPIPLLTGLILLLIYKNVFGF